MLNDQQAMGTLCRRLRAMNIKFSREDQDNFCPYNPNQKISGSLGIMENLPNRK